MITPIRIFVSLIILAFAVGGALQAQVKRHSGYVRSEKKATAIVNRVVKSSPVIDGHNDVFVWYFGCGYIDMAKCPQDIHDYPLDIVQKGHTDIPRWRKGGVGGVMINVFADSLSTFLDAYDLLYRLEDEYNNDLRVVTSSNEMRKEMKKGKIALVPTLEGSIRLENKLSFLRTFHQLGLRSVTFTYYTSDLADGSDDAQVHNGISELGRQMVKEMNKLGIIIDLSHVSSEAMDDILDETVAPVIFSHSNARAICDINRNVPDSILLRLKKNGGIVMIDMAPEHTSGRFAQWMSSGDSVYYSTLKLDPEERQKLNETMEQWERQNPQPEVTISEVADHFDYVKRLIGIEHIGISGDYDGIDYTIKGLEDVSGYPNLLIELARRGWTKNELRKICQDNFLRVFSQVEDVARSEK